MRRRWIYILILSLLTTLVSADLTDAKKKPRSNRKASRGTVKRNTNRGRVAKLSRNVKRTRTRVATRRKRGRRLARSRRSRREPSQASNPTTEPTTFRPYASGISSERVTEIQNALIKAGYMEGPASGQYDDATVDAMKQFQAANRMRQTGMPSAALLRKLGVSKRSNDGYAVPVTSVSENDKKRTPM